ncbi:hypothetical protein JB92DRAFT_3100957 [Gautieria morchelliformis]|nr:hypothetical protein JB92DRAFT_3100957 [Gautieria morchelliformis]
MFSTIALCCALLQLVANVSARHCFLHTGCGIRDLSSLVAMRIVERVERVAVALAKRLSPQIESNGFILASHDRGQISCVSNSHAMRIMGELFLRESLPWKRPTLVKPKDDKMQVPDGVTSNVATDDDGEIIEVEVYGPVAFDG